MPDARHTTRREPPASRPSPVGHSAAAGTPGRGLASSLTQRPLAPAPLQGLPRYYGRIRLLSVHRRRLMDSPSGYPPGLFGGRDHMNTPSTGHAQISLGPSIALSDHADPKHPRPAASGLAPYPSPPGGVPLVVGEASLSLRQLAPTGGHLGFAWTSAWSFASALFRLRLAADALRSASPGGKGTPDRGLAPH